MGQTERSVEREAGEEGRNDLFLRGLSSPLSDEAGEKFLLRL